MIVASFLRLLVHQHRRRVEGNLDVGRGGERHEKGRGRDQRSSPNRRRCGILLAGYVGFPGSALPGLFMGPGEATGAEGVGKGGETSAGATCRTGAAGFTVPGCPTRPTRRSSPQAFDTALMP